MQVIEFSGQNKRNNIYYSKRTIIKIIQSALLLAIALILNWISSNYFHLPFLNFLKFDFSLISLVMIALYINKKFVLIVAFIFVLIAPSFSTKGYEISNFFGYLVLITLQLIFTFVFSSIYSPYQKNKIKFYLKANLLKYQVSTLNCTKKPKTNRLLISKLFITVVLSSLIITILNVLITTPVYFWLYKISPDSSFITLAQNWKNYQAIFLNIPNYYLATILIYFIFNLLNLSLNSILIYILITINTKNKFIR